MNNLYLIKNKIRKRVLLATAIVLIIPCVLTGCKNKDTDSTESETTTEEITTATEVDTTTEVTEEPEKETLELSADEYYVDYPLNLEDGRQVYVKIVPSLGFYPEKEHPAVGTNLAAYTEMKQLITTLSVHADKGIGETSASVVYEMDNDYSFINYCIEGNVSGFTYEVSEPENWDNGIIAYKVDSDYGSDYVLTDYALYYPLEGDAVIKVYISGFLGDYYTSGEEFQEEHEEILNFYRTEENVFIVVDPEEVEVVVGGESDSLEVEDMDVESTDEVASNSSDKPTSTPETSEPPSQTSEPVAENTHTHSWSNATCTSPKTCTCGATSGSKLGHDFGSNNKACSRCGASNPNYTETSSSQGTTSTCSHAYGYGEINCMICGAPHTHDWEIVVQTNRGVECTPDEDFCCHSGWYFDTYEELRAHMDIPNVHGMVYLNDGSNGVTSVPPGYTGEVAFYACCHGWANCAGDGEGERIEYEITQEVQFCKLCGVRGEATDIGERVILSHTYDD